MDINITSPISQTITNGVTTTSPSENAVYDAITDTAITAKLLTGGAFIGNSILSSDSILSAFEATDNTLNTLITNSVSYSDVVTAGQVLLGQGLSTQWKTLSLNASSGNFGLSSAGVLTMPNSNSSTRGLLIAADYAKFQKKEIQLVCSDETTALTTGNAKVTFRMPYAATITGVRASLSTAQTGGSIFTVDINDGVNSILSTKLTIDNTHKTSTTATTPAVISDNAIADDAEVTIDIDQIGDGTAKGLKVTIYYTI